MGLDSARADRIAALVLFVLGMAMLWGGWSMDRLEIRQIHPASIPGLVPMLLGAVMALCAGLLWLGARDPQGGGAEPEGEVSWSNAYWALALCLVYALLLVGRLPFFWATAIFVAAFAGLFGWRDAENPPSRWRIALTASVYAVLISGAISALFRYGFLVRLP